jgi:lipopolysaccharide cholinephosphotransferase
MDAIESGTYEHLLQRMIKLQEQTNALQSEILQKTQIMFWLQLYSGRKTVAESQRSFWAAYPSASGDLYAIQRAILMLLKSLQAICQNNGLTMWLSGGTLIGAIRHKGFIPWDDDADVGLTRDDFEKLKMLLPDTEFCIKEYFHDTCCSKGYQFCYMDNRIPIFIDITPFDYCNCNSLTERQDFLERFRILRHEMEARFVTELNAPKCIDIGYSHFGPYSEEDRARVEALLSEYQDKLNISKEGNCLFYGLDNYPFGYPVMQAEKIKHVKTIPFESLMAMVPMNGEEYLQGYGDIWQLPKDIGVSPHMYAFIPRMAEIHAFVFKGEANHIQKRRFMAKD